MKLLPLILVATLLLNPYSALASCAPPPPLESRKAQADLVLVGEVSSTIGITGRTATVRVEKYYKGEGPSQVKVIGGPGGSSVTSVDMEFKKGQKYLLFLNKEADGSLKTNDCVGNIEITNSLTSEQEAVLGSGNLPSSQVPETNNVFIPAILSALALAFLIARSRQAT